MPPQDAYGAYEYDANVYRADDDDEEAPVVGGVGGIALAGNLFKMKRNHSMVMAAWNKRWFVVNGRMLHYFKRRSQSKPPQCCDRERRNRFECM